MNKLIFKNKLNSDLILKNNFLINFINKEVRSKNIIINSFINIIFKAFIIDFTYLFISY